MDLYLTLYVFAAVFLSPFSSFSHSIFLDCTSVVSLNAPNQIVQKWRSSSWPAGHFSVCRPIMHISTRAMYTACTQLRTSTPRAVTRTSSQCSKERYDYLPSHHAQSHMHTHMHTHTYTYTYTHTHLHAHILQINPSLLLS